MNPLVKHLSAVAIATALLAIGPISAVHADDRSSGASAPPAAPAAQSTEKVPSRPDGGYAGLSAGIALPSGLPNRSFTAITPAVTAAVTQGYGLNSGLSLAAQVGYELDAFRVEGEFLYQNMGRKPTTVTLQPTGGAIRSTAYGSSQVDTYSGFVNCYYDFNRNQKWSPYIGAGIGFTNVNSSQAAHNQLVTIETPGVSATVFAYQAKAGLSYNINEKTSLFLQYRYVGTSGFTYGGARVTAGTTIVNVPGISNGLSNSSIELGGRFKF